MRIETIEKKIFTFSELSKDAKEVVKSWYLEAQENDIFTDMCNESLASLFSKSELEVQYSLSSCQGDGFNIYGTLNLLDALKTVDFSDVEKEEIEKGIKVFSGYYDGFLLEENKRYSYCMSSYNKDAVNYVLAELKEDQREMNFDVFEKFLHKSIDFISELCKDFENEGYKFFYEVSEEELQEVCEVNNYEFTEEGKIFFF